MKQEKDLMKKTGSFFSRTVSRYSFHNLLVWLLVYEVAGPFVTGRHTQTILSIGISLILFFAVYAINTRGRIFKYFMGLMAATLLLYWLDQWHFLHFTNLASRTLLIVYLTLLIYSFTQFVLNARKVTSRLISATLCLYLLMGTLWGVVYDVLDMLMPGSYSGDLLANAVDATARFQHFQYFSFVTLTTLGYGDILPETEGAAALCQTEAIIGQFFMAVLVARLVGIQVSQQFSPQDNHGKRDQ